MKFVSQSYYEILDIDPAASDEEVKRAYRLVRGSFEPESMAIYSLYSPEETEAIGSKIDEAFRILTNRDRRRSYDKYLGLRDGGQPCPEDPDRFFDKIHDISELTPLEQFVEGAGDGIAALATAAVVDTEVEEVSAEVTIDIPEITDTDASLERVVDGPTPAAAQPAHDERADEEPTLSEPSVETAAADLTDVPEPSIEMPAGGKGQLSFDQTSASFPEMQEKEPAARAFEARPRLRAWTRDYAKRRRQELDSIDLKPLTEESLGRLQQAKGLSGSDLRQIRQQRGVDLETICDETKISIMYLRFIEDDRYDDLPAPIYVSGYIEKYARILDLPRDVVDRFMNQYQQHVG